MINSVNVVGRLTRDPETRSFASGTQKAAFGLAINNSRKNSSTGQWEDKPCFIDVEAWGKTAERVALMKKGNRVVVNGGLDMDKWQDQQGQQRSKVYIKAERVILMDAPSGGAAPSDQSEQPVGGSGHEGYLSDEIPF